MHYTSPEGKTIKYWTYHDDKKPTIIMVHGFTGSHKGFMYLEPLLAEYRLIVPDLPGFGESALPSETAWTIDALAQQLNLFVGSLRLTKPPIIFGHSMGGLVVSSMVHQNPKLYGDVILLSPVPTPIRLNDKRLLGAVAGALQYRAGSVGGKLGHKLVTNRQLSKLATRVIATTGNNNKLQDIIEHHYENLDYISDIRFYVKIHHDINRRGAIHYASELSKKRLLLIVGDKDSVTPVKEQIKFCKQVAPEQFEIIPGVGHLIHYERAEKAAEIIKAFLSHRR